MSGDPIYEQVKALFPLIPDREGWQQPRFVIAGRRKYRSKERYVVGYGHSRLYSHHMSGTVYDRVLGYGDTPEAALAMARQKLGASSPRGETP